MPTTHHPARPQLAPFAVRAQWWHRLDDGALQCDLCPRACKLREGQRGFCFVREARDGAMLLSAYGRAIGFCVDPIEKKPLNHFLPGSAVLSFGTAGCNLGCRFCQNWDVSKARQDDVMASHASPEQIAEAALREGCASIAYTYNDPIIFAEYAIDCAQEARARGIRNVAVSNGYMSPQARADFYAHMDAANIDLKSFSEDFYHQTCFAHLQPVLETLEWIKKESQVWLEVTTLLIPGHNDGEREIEQLCAWMVSHLGAETPLHFTAFHPDFRLTGVGSTPASTLSRARRQALAVGMQHVYTGNVRDPEGQATYCAGCRRRLIQRDGYRIDAYDLDAQGCCVECGAALAGRFAGAPGHWGARRLPISVGD